MKKILIICDGFPPAFAPRVGYLCKYLPHNGFQIKVLTLNLPDKHYQLEVKTDIDRITPDERDNWDKKSFILFPFMWIASFFWEDYAHWGHTIRSLKKRGYELCQKNKFDLIFTTTFRPLFPLTVSLFLQKKFNIPVVADLRDMLEEEPSSARSLKNRIARWREITRRNALLQSCDWVTTVSPYLASVLKKINPRSSYIFNGYDPEIFYSIAPQSSTKFKLTYAGSIGRFTLRSPKLLFQGLLKLVTKKIIALDDIEINFYIPEQDEMLIRNYLCNTIILPMCHFYRNDVPVHKMATIFQKSEILLLLANKQTVNGPKGVMTTKFFEYLGVGRPILLVQSDEDCLEKTLIDANAGCAARTLDDVYVFLKEKYTEWKRLGYTCSDIKINKIKQFSRIHQAKEFSNLFMDIILKAK